MKISFLLLLLSFITVYSVAQVHVHDHEKDHHHAETNGFGIAPTLVYDFNESAIEPGFHMHYIKLFGNKLGAGIGYEGVLGEHYHQTATIFGKYFLTDFLSVNAGPGITLPNEEHTEYSLTAHIEIATAFDWKSIHIGPMIGFGIGKEEKHASVGLHVGWHF